MQKTRHILIVDDDPQIRRLFGAKIAAAGFEVLYAKDGNEGREVARRLQPDLILMDLRMPVMDGFEAIGRMKDEPATANIPVILLTNEDLSIEAEKFAKELGVVEYIHKGIDLVELVERIKKVLQ